MPDDPALNLEQFAKVTVRLRAGTRRERALREAGIDTKTWLETQVYWLGRMASLVASGKSELHDRFLDYCTDLEDNGVGKLEALPDELDTGESPEPRLAPLRPEASSLPDATALPEAPAAPPRVSPAEIVSSAPVPPARSPSPHMAPPPAASSSGLPPAAMANGDDVETIDTEGQSEAERLRPSLPFQAPAISTTSRPNMSTMGMPQVDMARPSTPFEGKDGSGKPPAPVEPPRSPNFDPLMQTMAVDDRRELKIEALPFDAKSASTPASPSKTEAPPPAQGPVPLPFVKGDANPPPKIAVSDEQALADLGQTVGVGTKSPLASMALPFEGARGTNEKTSVPELTVEQYASLKATCEVYPERTEEAGRQYGVPTASQRKALEASWKKRLGADRALAKRLEQLVTEYRTWLASQRS